jgi:hypothetical protein
VVVFENRPDRHVQPYNRTPHLKGNTFYVGGLCDGRLELGHRQNQIGTRLRN